MQVVRASREDGDLFPLCTWGLDHEAAYRQLPARTPNHTFMILDTPFGPTLWRHNADFMAWLTRCLLITPTLHFLDDFGGTETEVVVFSRSKTAALPSV